MTHEHLTESEVESYLWGEERANWRLIGRGEGIHWPELDEDIQVAHLLLGIPSQESQASLRRWLEQRTT